MSCENLICIDDLNSTEVKGALEEGVDTLVEVVTEYRKIVDNIKTVEDNTLSIQQLSSEFQANQDFSQETIHMYQVACETYMTRINNIFEVNIFPSAKVLIANEGLAEDVLMAPIRFTFGSILNTWRIASKAFLDAVTLAYNMTEYFIKSTGNLKKRLDHSGKTPRRNKMRVSAASKLHVGGKIDPKSIKAGFKNAELILDTVTDKYRTAIYEHYKQSVHMYVDLNNTIGQMDIDRGGFGHAEAHLNLQKDFVKNVEKSLFNALKKLPKDVEMSGGRIFDFKIKSFSSTPEVFRKDPRITIPSNPESDVPTKQDIDELLSLVDAVANIVHRRKTNVFTTFYDIEKAIGEAIVAQRGNDTNVFSKVFGIIDGNFTSVFKHTWYAHPIAECTADVFFTSRKILSYCEDAIELYE